MLPSLYLFPKEYCGSTVWPSFRKNICVCLNLGGTNPLRKADRALLGTGVGKAVPGGKGWYLWVSRGQNCHHVAKVPRVPPQEAKLPVVVRSRVC